VTQPGKALDITVYPGYSAAWWLVDGQLLTPDKLLPGRRVAGRGDPHVTGGGEGPHTSTIFRSSIFRITIDIGISISKVSSNHIPLPTP